MSCYHGNHPCPACAGLDDYAPAKQYDTLNRIINQTSAVLNNRSKRCGPEDKIECALIAIIELCEEVRKVQTRTEGR